MQQHSPHTASQSFIACGSATLDLSTKPETGLKVSKPLAIDQGRPLALTASWTFRAVMSMARAVVDCYHASGQLRRAFNVSKGNRRDRRTPTVASDMVHRARLGDVAATLANNDAELNLVVNDDTLGDLDDRPLGRGDVRGRRLEKEERLLRDGVLELKRVCLVVPEADTASGGER